MASSTGSVSPSCDCVGKHVPATCVVNEGTCRNIIGPGGEICASGKPGHAGPCALSRGGLIAAVKREGGAHGWTGKGKP